MADVFDCSPWGIIQFDQAWAVQYANPAAAALCGVDRLEGKRLTDFVEDKRTAAFLAEQQRQRESGGSAEYELEITRPDTGRHVPIGVAAMPVVLPGQAFGGSVIMMRSLEVERASRHLNERTEDATTAEQVFEIAAEEIAQLIPFDAFTASSYSEAMEALVLVERPKFLDERRRWFSVPQRSKERLQTSAPERLDLRDFYEATKLPTLQRMIDRGFRGLLRCPVESRGRVIGTIALFTKDPDGFTERQLEIFRHLPLPKAFISAIYLQEDKELRFRFELIRDIAQCRDDHSLFKLFVDRVREHYGWSHVSIFTLDEVDERIVLESQSGKLPLPDDHSQPFTAGLLGRVRESGQDINVADVDDPQYRDQVYLLDQLPDLKSEVCMAIRSEGELYALLNIQDLRVHAVSSDEQETLRSLLDNVGDFIGRLRRDNLAAAVINAAPTAVLITDTNGKIRQANVAAQTLLGYDEPVLKGKLVSQFVFAPLLGDSLEENPNFSGEAKVVKSSGARVRVHVVASELEAVSNRRMIVLRDLSLAERPLVLAQAARMVSDLTRLSSTPLSILSFGLRELRARNLVPRAGECPSDKESVADLLGDLTAQLHRVEITYAGMQLYDEASFGKPYRETLIPLRRFVSDTLNDLPTSDVERLAITMPENVGDVRGDTFQLAFVLQTLAIHLLEVASAGETIQVRTETVGGRVRFVFETMSDPEADEYQPHRTLLQARGRAALRQTEATLRQFIRNHRGTFDPPVDGEGGRVQYFFDLPVADDANFHA